MSHRSSKSRLAASACLAIAACLATSGREARSSLRMFAGETADVGKEYYHKHPLTIRIKLKDKAATFDPTSTVTVAYTDEAGGAAVSWRVLFSKFTADNKKLLLVLHPIDPRRMAHPATGTPPTGTGTIIVTTTTTTTSTSSDAIDVTAIQTEDYP